MFKMIGRCLLWLMVLAVVTFLAVGIFLFIDYKRFISRPMVVESSAKTLVVNSGDTISSLIKTFNERGLPIAPDSPFSQSLGSYYFRYLAKSTEQSARLKIGEYALRQGMTPPEVLRLLTSGKTIAYKVRFLEGWNFKQLRDELSNNSHLEQTLIFVPDTDIMSTLGVKEQTVAEGWFFPDTYQFPRNTKDIDILRQAYQLMQKNLKKAWQARDKNIVLKTPYELLILASIIEKETALDSERRQVSGVFHRRLAKGMPLQTDPTVIYGLGEKYRGKIYKSDLKRDTPYNTYTRKGLPPTPIAMPGMASLLAAGQPDSGRSLYFVADGTGGHVFSETYKQHLKAVRDYRRKLAK